MAVTSSDSPNFTGSVSFDKASFNQTTTKASITNRTPSAVNATATLTAAQVQAGYIASTSPAAVTMTLPTGAALGAQVNASQGSSLELHVDNTAGANTVTIAPSTNAVVSALGAAAASSAGLLTVPAGPTGVARFTIMFSSPTAYVITRVG